MTCRLAPGAVRGRASFFQQEVRADFDHDAHRGGYRRRLRKLVEDKEAGETIKAPPSPKTPGPPPDIMEALKASLDKVRAR